LDWAERASSHYVMHPDVILRARAALAQPEPQGSPIADAEAKKMVAWLRDECDAEKAEGNWVRMTIDQVLDVADLLERLSQPEPQGPTDDDLAFLYYVHCGGSNAMGQVGFEDAARAVLVRWGRPAVEPVPVSERLPKPEECGHPEGECWWFDPASDGAWYIDTYQGNYTHWLPHWALPAPQQEAGK